MKRGMKRVMVTGGSGFVGGQLVRRLVAEGVEPVVPRRAETDLRDRAAVFDAVRQARPGVIFHCAMSSGHPKNAAQRLESLASSVMGTAYLAEAAAEAGVERFIHIGSSLVYGPQNREFRESDGLRPPSSRGAAKACAALWLRQYAESTGFPAVELRLFSVYGPGEAPHRFIPTLLRAAITGEFMPLVAGPRHDFIYIEDVVDACLCAARVATAPGAVFNIGSGVSRANEEVVEMARQVTGRPIPIAATPHPGSPADQVFWCADINAAREHLAWAPRHSLPEGLAATYQWMRRSR
jgi:nucleoside-diphosphate-sugar epimerase